MSSSPGSPPPLVKYQFNKRPRSFFFRKLLFLVVVALVGWRINVWLFPHARTPGFNLPKASEILPDTSAISTAFAPPVDHTIPVAPPPVLTPAPQPADAPPLANRDRKIKKLPYSPALAGIISPSDWQPASEAIQAAMDLGQGELVRWSNRANNHRGTVTVTGGANSEGCVPFRLSCNRGNGSEVATGIYCAQDNTAH